MNNPATESKHTPGLALTDFNHLRATYDTPDGTKVAAELVENAESPSDIFRVASVREHQRAALHQSTGGADHG